ncbi:MAG: hypothetical protein II875_01575 [Clostridia bacterium]|nr:hypothetical protein [Clostridia bacterium]
MDLDAAITTVLVVILIITPIITAVLLFFTLRQRRKLDELMIKMDETARRIEELNRENRSAISEELARQRRMLTESLSDLNDNLTRGVVNMSKNRQ